MSSPRDTHGLVIGVSTRIQLGILVTFASGIVAVAWSWAHLDGRVGRIEEKIGELVDELRAERSRNWTAADQAHFMDALEGFNPTLKVPKIKNGG